MQSQWKWATLAIVSVTVAIVLGPVLIPREIARWYLAAAANSFRKNDQVVGQHYLTRALAWDSSLSQDGDYWIAQLPPDGIQTADDRLDLMEKAIRTDGRWAPQAIRDSETFAERQDYQRAIRAMKMAFVDGRPHDADHMNQLAYYRALAGVELKEALKDITRAIEIAGNNGSLLDTKAWVLHGMHHDVEALAFINDAITQTEKELKARRIVTPGPLPPAGDAADAASADHSSDQTNDGGLDFSDDGSQLAAARKRFGAPGWNIAVLRYHRLKILEALKMYAEAEEERRWLIERGVPISDELS